MGHGAYGASKLALNTWSFWLAEQLRGHVTVNCVDPGTVHTKLLFTGWGDVSYAAMRTDVGAQLCALPTTCALLSPPRSLQTRCMSALTRRKLMMSTGRQQTPRWTP